MMTTAESGIRCRGVPLGQKSIRQSPAKSQFVKLTLFLSMSPTLIRGRCALLASSISVATNERCNIEPLWARH